MDISTFDQHFVGENRSINPLEDGGFLVIGNEAQEDGFVSVCSLKIYSFILLFLI